MDAEALRQAVAQANFGALWIGFVTGFVFSFNPVALAAIPVSLAYVTTSRTSRQATLCSDLPVLHASADCVAWRCCWHRLTRFRRSTAAGIRFGASDSYLAGRNCCGLAGKLVGAEKIPQGF